MAPLMSEIAKRYQITYPESKINIRKGGSSKGIRDVHMGIADIGMSSRSLKKAEKQESICHVLARDGVGIVVNSENPVATLSNQQIVGIFTGRVKNWSEVGGEDQPIRLLNRPKGTSEFDIFTRFFHLDEDQLNLESPSLDTSETLDKIVGDRNSVSFVSVGASEFEKRIGKAVKLLSINDVVPSLETVGSGEYPISRPLVLITRKDTSVAAKDFIDYAMSDMCADLVGIQFQPVKPAGVIRR